MHRSSSRSPQPRPAGSPKAGADLLAGTWIVDFDESWNLSKAAFLKDTLRGASAYPEDEAAKEGIVRGEMAEFLSGKGYTVAAANEISSTIGGAAAGTYEVQKTDGSTIHLAVNLGKKMDMAVTFIKKDLVHWRIKGSRGDMLLALRRQ